MKTFSILLVCDDKHRPKISFSDFDHENLQEVKFNLKVAKNLGNQISKCDLVVTCGDWNDSEICERAVQMARLMEIDVIHQTRYKDYVGKKYNR